MNDNLTKNDQRNAGQTPAQQQADEIHRENPGLKDGQVQRNANNDKNEGGKNEKEAIEETSEDRLSEAE